MSEDCEEEPERVRERREVEKKTEKRRREIKILSLETKISVARVREREISRRRECFLARRIPTQSSPLSLLRSTIEFPAVDMPRERRVGEEDCEEEKERV